MSFVLDIQSYLIPACIQDEWVRYTFPITPISDWPHSAMNLEKERQTDLWLHGVHFIGSTYCSRVAGRTVGSPQTIHMYGLGQMDSTSDRCTSLGSYQNQTHSNAPKTTLVVHPFIICWGTMQENSIVIQRQSWLQLKMAVVMSCWVHLTTVNHMCYFKVVGNIALLLKQWLCSQVLRLVSGCLCIAELSNHWGWHRSGSSSCWQRWCPAWCTHHWLGNNI